MCKTCTKCNIEKSINDFYKDVRKTDGLRSWCKECQRNDNKKREFKYNDTRRKYREENKEESKIKKNEYYKLNREKILIIGSKWRRETFNGRLSSYKRSALLRNIEWNITDEQFKSFWNLDCIYCGDSISTIGIDRVDSSKGYIIDNIVPCCYQCNIIKMDYTEQEFLNKIKQIYELQRSKGRFDQYVFTRFI